MFLSRSQVVLVCRGFHNSLSRFFSSSNLDCRPLALRVRVDFLIRLPDLDTAAKHARLAAMSSTRDPADQFNITCTCNAIIGAMCEAKRYKDALDLFHYFFRESKIKPERGYFNPIIKYHLDQGRLDEALNLYNPSLANSASKSLIAEALVDACRLDEVISLLKPRGGFLSSDVSKSLVRGLLLRGDLEKANEVLGDIMGITHVHDTGYDDVANVSSVFMEYWFEQGKEEEAIKCYNNVKLRKGTKATTVNTLLDLLLKYGRKTEAWSLFKEVLDSEEMFILNSDTLNIMVNECFKMGRFDQAVQTFNKVKASKSNYIQVSCYTNIITRFSECGMLLEAEQFFQKFSSDRVHPDVSTYTIMIDAYLKAGRTEDALRISNRMVDAFMGEVAWLACL
ncbi:hypothetical protein AALP_AA5G266100 [Arabis alpina]|uniref:Pentacotripeptide-repeat region of PRORP domain-containing protein n=1 Tax=Arabis alpina TaxID=50452 RepID=A0A087GZJ3_ARAAL|nr:hypothetical protein AALP_AA5G266100 [Arabis alpina]